MGQRILKVDLPDREINVSPLPPGVYLLKFDIDGQGFTDRLIISKSPH